MKEYKLGSVVTMKKGHPCGENKWIVTRIGIDVKIKCTNVGWIFCALMLMVNEIHYILKKC